MVVMRVQQSGRARRRLDVVEFFVGRNALGVGEVDTVTPYVNGISLIELARRSEVRPATEQGEPGLAGGYAGLVIDERTDWRHWYLNDEPQTCFGDGDSCLLGCICGATSCWPLTARVSVADSQIAVRSRGLSSVLVTDRGIFAGSGVSSSSASSTTLPSLPHGEFR